MGLTTAAYAGTLPMADSSVPAVRPVERPAPSPTVSVGSLGWTTQAPPAANEQDEQAAGQEAPGAGDQAASIAVESVPTTPPDFDSGTESSESEPPPAPPALAVPLNSQVRAYIVLFTGRLRGYLEDGLNRGARYLPMIRDVFRSEGVPLDLAYVPLVESAFKPNAVSRAKAAGIWQFMHGTALENGLKHDWYIDERADPEKATRAAARYLKTLYGMFGDWNLALASYNGGPGRVQRAIKRAHKDDFWELSRTKKYLPRETRDYVPLILAAVTIARNPSQYGMTILTPDDVPGVELVTLPSPVDLRRVAEWIGEPVHTLQDLNPELRRWTTPIRGSEYALKVPEGQADVVRAHLVDGVDAMPLTRYVVKKNDTLATVARKLGVTRSDLAEANYLKTSAKVHPGQTLIVPRAPAYATTALASLSGGPAAPDAVNAVALSDVDVPGAGDANVKPATVTNRTTSAPPSTATVRVVHKVKSGETLGAIADTYDTTVSAIRRVNHLSGATIRTGQRLTIVVKRPIATD
jgi:membrane-bound lytic murein transglycosylase D